MVDSVAETVWESEGSFGSFFLFARLTAEITAMQTTSVAAITAMAIFVLFVIYIVLSSIGNNLKNGPSRKRPGPRRTVPYAAVLEEASADEAGALLEEEASAFAETRVKVFPLSTDLSERTSLEMSVTMYSSLIAMRKVKLRVR